MDLMNPVQSVAPGAHAAVLGVLVRTDTPLSGSRIAALTRPAFTARRVNQVLGDLFEAGLVTRQSAPPSYQYQLNRDHVAAEGLIALDAMWATLMARMKADISSWDVPPVAAWLFGSAARGEASVNSDIDVLLVVPGGGPTAEVLGGLSTVQEEAWERQTRTFADKVRAWSGNACELLELSAAELAAAADRDDRLVRELRSDAVVLAGRPPRSMLRAAAAGGRQR